MSDPTKVLITVLSGYERHGWHHPSITDFLFMLRWEQRYATNYAPVCGFSPAASARNVIAKHFMESEAEVLMMVDNDMLLPANILDTLKDAPEDWGILVPTFYLWNGDKPSVTLCWGMPPTADGLVKDGDREYYAMKPGFHELTKCGTGVIFIKREAFAKIEYPYFTYKYNDDGCMVGTEDIAFCNKAREAGVKIYGNSDIRCGHLHQVNLLTLADMVYSGKGIAEAQRKQVDTAKQPDVSSSTEMVACPASV